MTMPVEATEHAGPVIIWRKELREDSGGIGTFRGGLGQFMEVGVAHGYEFDFSAMFDRVKFPARGRHGGGDGAATELKREDGSRMQAKGKQLVPHGGRVYLAFPGGAGYGAAAQRDRLAVCRDLLRGYISVESALSEYGLTDADVAKVKQALQQGDEL